VIGNAVLAASEELREMLVAEAADELGVEIEDVRLEAGAACTRSDSSLRMSVGEMVSSLNRRGIEAEARGSFAPAVSDALDPTTGAGIPYGAYSYATHIVDVAVDTDTGQVGVERLIACHDVGHAISMSGAQAQVQGAVAMGLGYAISEEMMWDEGRLRTKGFDTYLIPTALDVPRVETVFVEVLEPSGPFGAVVLGEPAICPTAGAVANAVRDALGCDAPASLPLTAEKVFDAQNQSDEHRGGEA
jgi:CO/xanthine dehydrogenase Mo-binding subunit